MVLFFIQHKQQQLPQYQEQNNVKNVKCKTCDANTYQADHEMEAGSHNNKTEDCIKCAAGFFAKHTGSIAVRGCSPCAAGKQAGTTECTECLPGQVSSSITDLKCEDCKVGKYQDQTGLPSCIKCIPGQYQDVEGETKCRECREGKHEAEPGAGIIVKRDTPTVCTECKYKCFFISFHL